MNEVKRSLDALAGDVSSDKAELKQRILSGKRKPKRRNPLPFVATAIVLAAVLFLSFSLLDGEFSGKKSAYTVDETLFDLILLNEQKAYPDRNVSFDVLHQILKTDALLDFAKSEGYEEDLPGIKEQVEKQKQHFYSDFSEEELRELKENQLETFGYPYDQYFDHILLHTARHTAASEWLGGHPPEQAITFREVLDRFLQENEQEITEFKEKKQIDPLAEQNEYVTFDVLITSVESDTAAGAMMEEEQVRELSAADLEELVVRFKIGESAADIEPFTWIRITYDPLSYPIQQAERPKLFEDVESWEAIEGPDGLH